MRLAGRLPLPLLYALAPLLYGLACHVLRYRRSVVRENLARVYRELPARDRARLARRYYRRLADLALEILAAHALPPEAFRQRVQIDNAARVEELSDGFRTPLLLLTIHQGNWEWMLHGVGQALGRPLTPVYKPLHDADSNQFIHEVRCRFGAQPVGLAELSRLALRQRRAPRLWVMLADQAPVPGERSQPVQFLEQRTRFHAGPLALARRLDLPVLFVHCRRRARGHYRVWFETLSVSPATESEASLVQRYADTAGRAIREEPEGWLWSNRRWKRDASEGP
jgi:KDO2-lipid IV(A) lauroyltransferase